MAATPKTMQQSTLSFGLGLTGVAPPPPSAVTRAVMAPADAGLGAPGSGRRAALDRARAAKVAKEGDNPFFGVGAEDDVVMEDDDPRLRL